MLCYLKYALCIHVSTGIVTLEIPSDEQAKFLIGYIFHCFIVSSLCWNFKPTNVLMQVCSHGVNSSYVKESVHIRIYVRNRAPDLYLFQSNFRYYWQTVLDVSLDL